MIDFAVLGFGARGQLYANLLIKEGAKLTAICDINPVRINDGIRDFKLEEEQCYLNDQDFFAKGRLARLLVLSTLDQNHYEQTLQAIELGYDILLEKPIACSLNEVEEIYAAATKHQTKIFICYVLRYAPFFMEIKSLLDSGKFGEIATINLTEHVGYWHQAHSFVRGNWRNAQESTPMIVQKCCHDLDIISWFMGNDPKYVSSMGELMLFKKENAPKNAAKYCFACQYRHTCPYENSHFYKKYPWWIKQVGWYSGDLDDKKAIEEVLKNTDNPYSRCVYYCDNTVVDHQVTNIYYQNGATAHLTMTAFSNDTYRDIHVHCTFGEIYGNMIENVLHCKLFRGEKWTVDLNKNEGIAGHGGGDALMIHQLMQSYLDEHTGMKSAIREALISHKLAFLSEESRLQKGKRIKI